MIRLEVQTNKSCEMLDITNLIEKTISDSNIKNAICICFVPHTTAAITINEGADPMVVTDIINTLNTLIPSNLPYKHLEGNSPAHIKATIIGPSESFIVEDGRIRLGRWQRLFFCEFDGPRKRSIWLKFLDKRF